MPRNLSHPRLTAFCAVAFLALGVAVLIHSCLSPARTSQQPATAAPAVDVLPAAAHSDCLHQHDGGPLHSHDETPSAAAQALPPRGLAHQVALGGDAVKSFFLLDQIVLGLEGVDPDSREFVKLLGEHQLALLRREPALHAVVVRHDGPGRIEPVIARLRQAAGVVWAEPNYVATLSQCCHTPFYTDEDPVAAHNAAAFAALGLEEAHRITRGNADIVIAVLDSGVDAKHEDLAGAVLVGRDFVNRDDDAADDNGHGTGLAGLMAAREDNANIGIAGVAPGCRILPVKVADRAGKASFADLAAGIVYAVDRGARILNISLGSRTSSRLLDAALAYAEQHDAVVIAAAGNDNTNVTHFPAAAPAVIAVGALSPDGSPTAVTNLSPRLDLLAPGEKLISTIPGGFYRSVSGTSVAAAVTSAAAALLLSVEPRLTAAQVRQALRAATDPIAVLAPVAELFPAGRLNLARLLQRARTELRDLGIAALRTVPSAPRPGQTLTVEVELVNAGAVPTATVAPVLEGLAGLRLTHGLADGETLALGARRVLVYEGVAPAAGRTRLTARMAAGDADAETARNDRRALDLAVVDAARPELTLIRIDLSEPSARAERMSFGYELRNTGNVALAAVHLRGTLDGAALSGDTACDLAIGARASAQFTWTLPNPAPAGTRTFAATYACAELAAGQTIERPWTFILGNNHDGRELDPLYQQSGETDIIADAPHRVAPGRGYLPLLFFIPTRGSSASGPVLVLDHVTVTRKTSPDPAVAGTVVYDDTNALTGGADPTVALPGTVQIDEDGAAVTRPDGSAELNLFRGAGLAANGRHAILRLPRTALGIPATPAATVTQYLQVDVHWKFYTLAGALVPTKEGVHNWTLKVEWGSSALPSLPGANRYYDTHNHTIAEWHQALEVEPFSPMQSYGGPIQMIRESAWAVGLIDDATDIHGKVITTDHNGFYANPLDSTPNSPLHRPPFGPTSVARSTGADGTITDEYHRMRALFGPAAGEEITFSQDIYHSGYPIPIGAHLLGYRAAQQPGTWHGGSFASLALGEGSPLLLESILSTMAKGVSADNLGAFAYAAHPYAVQGWYGDNMSKSIGVLPMHRTYDNVSDSQTDFVFRGLQIYNGYDNGVLPAEKIDFQHVNPWVHEEWNAGPGWDRELQVGLRNWHELMSKVMSWSFYDKVGRKFVRKLYLSAGSDAHGNFNFSTSRLAMLVPMPSTFGVSKSAFGSCRSYLFTEGKKGATEGDRAMQALADGNHVATDGPVIRFSMDADGRYDSVKQQWHDKTTKHENADGRMGGGGAFGGEGTVLVRRSSTAVQFGYRWANTADYGSDGGDVKSILIYKDVDGEANPQTDRLYAPAFEKVVRGVGSLPVGTRDSDLAEAINSAEEGTIDKVSCYSLGAFTGSNPDVTPLAGAEHRCYTNPVWAIPYDVEVVVKSVNKVDKRIDPGQLEVRFNFDLSMSPLPYKVGVKKLSAAGTTSDQTALPLTEMTPLGVWGTNFKTGADFAKFAVTNAGAIPLTGDDYPAVGKCTFMVYFMEPLQDVNGNALHSIATTVTVDKPGAPAKCFVAATATAAAPGPVLLLLAGLMCAALRGRRRCQ